MREVIGSYQEAANINMNVLNNATNRNGKRVLQLDSEKVDAKRNFRKSQGWLKDSSFMRESCVPSGTLVEEDEMMNKVIDEPVAYEKMNKDLFSSGPTYPLISMNLDFIVGSEQTAISSLLSQTVNCTYLAHGFTDNDKFGQCSTPPQCTDSSEPSVEVEEEDYFNHHEDDTADSVTYDFLTGKDDDKYGTCDLIGIPSAEGEIDSSGDPNNHSVNNTSSSSDYKMDDIPKVLNAAPSCEIDLGKESSCKCSFCLKAAYIWTDLHYQDIRCRLSALKKSKRLVKSLEERFSNNDCQSKISGDSMESSVKLDVELMHRWRSLFRHTDSVLVHETAKLHSTYLGLKALRVNCQNDVKRTSSFPLP